MVRYKPRYQRTILNKIYKSCSSYKNLQADYKKFCKSTYIGASWTNYSCNRKSRKKKPNHTLPESTYRRCLHLFSVR